MPFSSLDGWSFRPGLRSTGALFVLWGSLSGGLQGCAGTELSSRVHRLQSDLQQVIAQGSKARGCAPKETAFAEAKVKFAEDAMNMGEYFRARSQLREAEMLTEIADYKTSPEQCREEVADAGAGRDRDGDGYEDAVDQCPDQPEDFDSFQDEDGCPDEDNDGDGVPDATQLANGVYINKDHRGGKDCRNLPEDMDGFEDEDGCPDPDNDGDGIEDEVDACPNQAEDLDGYRDEDGCPDPDNDGDKIPDVRDQCPNEPEDMDGDADEDGCPDLLAKVDGCKISVDEKVFFARNRWKVDAKSFALLNDVSTILQNHREITLEIAGHTDSRGSERYNLRLSQQRVDAVRTYLLGRGIAATRLTSVGYGESTPIDSNQNAAGRARNRRVEFVRTDGSCNKN